MKQIFILIVLCHLLACENKTTESQQEEFNFENKIFLSTLKNQLKTGAMGEMYETDYPIYEYSLSDLEAIEEIIDKELEKKDILSQQRKNLPGK